MTSVNFNAAATSALRTLQATNTSLDATQNRISTGLKIGEAKDNAAYWSISTTLKSDNKALSTVKDALSLGSATIDTAYQGLNSTIDVLNEIKSKIVSATQAGVDKVAVQAEISALQDQLRSIANSSVFSGQNLLSTNTTTTPTTSVVASYSRDGTAVTIGTIDITLSDVALLDAGGADGMLEENQSGTYNAFMSSAIAGVTGAETLTTDSFGFQVTAGDSGAVNVTVNAATIQQALNIASGSAATVSTNAALAKVLNQALSNAKVSGVTAEVIPVGAPSAGQIRFVSDKTFTLGAASLTGTTDTFTLTEAGLSNASRAVTTTSSGQISQNILGIDITSLSTTAEMKALSEVVNKVINDVTAAASKLGAVAKRLDLQSSFVSTLMDTVEKGVSGLIDADMNEESTKLQALQVKQQLGVQALSIANQSAQNVLSLFRS